MRLYFVRHGESTANLLHEFSNTGRKHPLTPTGIEQAHAVAHSLSGMEVSRIYTSPVLRAVETAQILAETLQAPLETTEALREWSVGIYEGTRDPAGWELHRKVQEDWFVKGLFDRKMPGGESLYDIQKRFTPFIENLVREVQGTNQNQVLVGHGGLYLAMLPIVLTNVTFAFAARHGFSYTGCAVAESRPDGLYCRSWCGIRMDGTGKEENRD